MECPRCGRALSARTRGSVAVDSCSRCRGVWLDRGELEAIVAVLHSHAREKTSVRVGLRLGEQSLHGRQRTGTWVWLKRLFDSGR